MPQPNCHLSPTKVRLSKHFLLSDFMGCHSVYHRGYPNLFEENNKKLREGRTLCEQVLEPLLARSRLSISYGYISPELSRQIVKYQDPNKPSYHRWDAGAACDVVLHDCLAAGEPPIRSAFWIDENLPVSRTITYSESPFICVASRYEEVQSGDHRRALYENRYVGERKPKYISYSDNPTTRRRQKQDCQLDFDWRGSGHPTYHGGGIQQLHHISTGRYSVLSDFLYSDETVETERRNTPATQRSIRKFNRAGAIYDALLDTMHVRRMSIVRGYESPLWSESRHNWAHGIFLVVIPPEGVKLSDVEEAARQIPGVHTVSIPNDGVERRVGIGASLHE